MKHSGSNGSGMSGISASSSEKVLVVGGGIGGLTLAVALLRAGFEVELVERAPQFRPVGAGIILGPNAMGLLQRLGLAESIRTRGRPLAELRLCDEAGRSLSVLSLRRLAARLAPSIAIHRALLHEALLEVLPTAILRPGVEPIELDAQSGEVAFSDGSRGRYALVVGSDGIRSAVRRHIEPAAAPSYVGYTCWRWVAPASEAPVEPVELWGRGQRVGLVPLGNGQLYGFAVMDAPAGRGDPLEGRLERLRQRFASFGGPVPKALAAIPSDEAVLHNDLEEVRLQHWAKGRVALLGDAAHAASPNLGQGAAMAIEDAWVLAEAMRQARELQRPLESAVAVYLQQRRGRVLRMQDASRRMGQLGQWSNPIACWLRSLVLRATPDALSAWNLEKLLLEGPAAQAA